MTMTCARYVHLGGILVGVVVEGAGRRWLWAPGTVSDLRLSGRWSSYLLRAAMLPHERCTNRQIKSTTAIALENPVSLVLLRELRLRPTRFLAPGFVAGRVRMQWRLRPCAVNPVIAEPDQ